MGWGGGQKYPKFWPRGLWMTPSSKNQSSFSLVILRFWPARKLDQFCSSSSAILASSHEYWSEIVNSICRSAIEFSRVDTHAQQSCTLGGWGGDDWELLPLPLTTSSILNRWLLVFRLIFDETKFRSSCRKETFSDLVFQCIRKIT